MTPIKIFQMTWQRTRRGY